MKNLRSFSKRMNVLDLIGYFQDVISELQGFNGSSEVKLSSSTYNMRYPCQINDDGFIDLDLENIDRFIKE